MYPIVVRFKYSFERAPRHDTPHCRFCDSRRAPRDGFQERGVSEGRSNVRPDYHLLLAILNKLFVENTSPRKQNNRIWAAIPGKQIRVKLADYENSAGTVATSSTSRPETVGRHVASIVHLSGAPVCLGNGGAVPRG